MIISWKTSATNFFPYPEFSESLADRKPETEEEINRTAVKGVEDLNPLVGPDWIINDRVMRFLLNLSPEPKVYDRGEAEKRKALEDFLDHVPLLYLLKIYGEAQKPYFQQPRYKESLDLLSQIAYERACNEYGTFNTPLFSFNRV